MSMEAQISAKSVLAGVYWRRAIAGWSWLVLEASWFILAKTGRAGNAERRNRVVEKRMVGLRSWSKGLCVQDSVAVKEKEDEEGRESVEGFIPPRAVPLSTHR